MPVHRRPQHAEHVGDLLDLLIGLGATVSVITSAMGYYKFRERSFNLQQTADSIEQHLAALDLAILRTATSTRSRTWHGSPSRGIPAR
ncbi:hypothetical protein ABZX62_32605 [Streptomyces flavidovirens]|uniref:hypothetical protein n=1 Tax=Streptomyces flavidovirens TaxID=67298 RepID=UPI0033A1B4C2